MNGLEDKTEAEALCQVMIPREDLYGYDGLDDGDLVDLDAGDELGVYDDDGDGDYNYDDDDDGEGYDSEWARFFLL